MRPKILFAVISLVLVQYESNSWASKKNKVDLDTDSTAFVVAETGVDAYNYIIDSTACACWIHYGPGSSTSTLASVECKKLKAYPQLSKYLEKCS